MTATQQRRALSVAVRAARAAGALMNTNLRSTKVINQEFRHDIKLELDVRCQRTIADILHRAFPHISLLGEEGVAGDPQAPYRWVVDPIDGTVNYSYGIPHACCSIALQRRKEGARGYANADFESLIGVVYDPFCRELWTAIRGGPALLNGVPVQVSQRRRLAESVIALGFGKRATVLRNLLPEFEGLALKVRKLRILGAAALELCYVASGRLEAFVETGVRLWDVAAGGLIIECAGGEFWHEQLPGEHKYRVVANNGLLRSQIEKAIS